jgi:hypothetical protein
VREALKEFFVSDVRVQGVLVNPRALQWAQDELRKAVEIRHACAHRFWLGSAGRRQVTGLDGTGQGMASFGAQTPCMAAGSALSNLATGRQAVPG